MIDVKPDPIAGQFAGMLAPSYMATQVDVIQSDRVARRVVRNLKLADNPQVRADWLEATGGQGDIEAWIAGRFSSNMDVRPSRESNVISVSYRAPDPGFAAALANAFVQAYIDTALELKVDPGEAVLLVLRLARQRCSGSTGEGAVASVGLPEREGNHRD